MDHSIPDQAEKLTLEQLMAARRILDKVMQGDSRFGDGALLGAVVVAMATNFSTLHAVYDRANSD